MEAQHKQGQVLPLEWEVWTIHQYYKHLGSTVIAGGYTGTQLLEIVPDSRFFFHREANLLEWDPPEGWDEHEAKKHRDTSRSAVRKLLSTYADDGEGRLCHPDVTPANGYPQDGPLLQECPLDPTKDDGTRMVCERLDPMFCPSSEFCTEWDCKCYSAGNNDNTTITGTLGHTVYNGAKSAQLSCGCPTYEYLDENSASATAYMSVTAMPFVDKADQHGDRVMTHECCADWFVGYQCTLWSYPNGSSPVCLTMFDNHKLRECAATTCCSSYTTDISTTDSGGAGAGPGPEGFGAPGMGGFGPPGMWFDPFGYDPYGYDGGYGGYGAGYDPFFPAPPGDGFEGGGEACEVSIMMPGTFIGQFHPFSHAGEGKQDDAQLLRQRLSSPAAPIGTVGGHGDTHVRMNENVVFKGKFVPDEPAVQGQDPDVHSTVQTSEHGDFSKPLSPAVPRILPQEALPGAPGSPGGQKAERDAAKMLRRKSVGDQQTGVNSRLLHSRQLLSVNLTNATLGSADVVGTVKGVLSMNFLESAFGLCNGDVDEISDEMVLQAVNDWVRGVLNDDPLIDSRDNDPYQPADIVVTAQADADDHTQTDLAAVGPGLRSTRAFGQMPGSAPAEALAGGVKSIWTDYSCRDGESICEWQGYGPEECLSKGCCSYEGFECWSDVGNWPCSSQGIYDFPIGPLSAQVMLDISVSVRDEAHRSKIVDLLSTTLLTSPFDMTGFAYGQQGGEFPGDAQYLQDTPSRWTEQPRAEWCGDGVVQAATESCDEGSRLMNEYSSCNQCRCNDGFVVDEVSGGCICAPAEPDTGATIHALETSAVQGEENNITFAIQLTKPVTGVNSDGIITNPVILTISGLEGASVASTDGEVNITCQHWLSDSKWNETNETCRLGLAPLSGTSEWRYGRANWDASMGTLKFTVLGALESGGDTALRRFQLTLTIINAESLQEERRPTLSVCSHPDPGALPNFKTVPDFYQRHLAHGALSATGYILGASAKKIGFSSDNQQVGFQKIVSGRSVTVAQVRVPAGSMPPNSELIVYAPEADVYKGLSEPMSRRIPYTENGDEEDVIAGAVNTMLKLELRHEETKAPAVFLNDEVHVELQLDQLLLRRRGGCYTPESNTVRVCLPGYVGLYREINTDTQNEWQFVPDVRQSQGDTWPSRDSRMYTSLISKIRADELASTSYIALAVAPCNDYGGAGRAGGDLICLPSSGKRAAAFASLGGGRFVVFMRAQGYMHARNDLRYVCVYLRACVRA